MIVNHMNYMRNRDTVFCYAKMSVDRIDWSKCLSCQYFNGDIQGNGVECIWDDPKCPYPHYNVSDPEEELYRVSNGLTPQQLSKEKHSKKG